MVLENVKEMWTETPKTQKNQKQAKPVNKDRFISKMFLRGDSGNLMLSSNIKSNHCYESRRVIIKFTLVFNSVSK